MELPIELKKYEHIAKEGRTATYPDDQNTALTGGGDGLDHSGYDDLGAGENHWASRIRRDEIFLEINQENSPKKKLVKRKINELREGLRSRRNWWCFRSVLPAYRGRASPSHSASWPPLLSSLAPHSPYQSNGFTENAAKSNLVQV